MLNEVVLRHDTDRFVTAAVLRLRREETPEGPRWSATVGSGGHPLPYLLRRGRPPAELGRPGSLLGVHAAARFRDEQVVLAPGDTLVLYTDGVTEGRRGKEFYGERRLVGVLQRGAADAGALARDLVADVLAFQDGNARDDIAVVVVRVPD
jgi:sigma-B regulation protein RsbU (phosphoserine phosphatase)